MRGKYMETACGPSGEKFNRKVVNEWMKKGIDVQMLHKDDPMTKVHLDQMWDSIKKSS
jgi:hypothetical protein